MTRDLFPRALRERLRPTGRDVPHPGVFSPHDASADRQDPIARFTRACEAVGGRVTRVGALDEAATLVLGYLEPLAPPGHVPGARAPFVAWDDTHLPWPELPSCLRAAGAPQLDARVRVDQADRVSDYARLDAAAVGVTGAHALLADTGSIVLVHGEGRPRLASLLPPVHVALVRADAMYATLGDFTRARPGVLRDAANVVIVTGPSRTADIEMTLTRGVHGPRLVHVLVIG